MKKFFNLILIFSFLCGFVFFASSCNKKDKDPDKVTVRIDPTTYIMEVGDTLKLDYSPKDNITWTSSDENVASVSTKGEVVAFSAGHTTITATHSTGSSATCAVTVNQPVKPTFANILPLFTFGRLSIDGPWRFIGDSYETVTQGDTIYRVYMSGLTVYSDLIAASENVYLGLAMPVYVPVKYYFPEDNPSLSDTLITYSIASDRRIQFKERGSKNEFWVANPGKLNSFASFKTVLQAGLDSLKNDKKANISWSLNKAYFKEIGRPMLSYQTIEGLEHPLTGNSHQVDFLDSSFITMFRFTNQGMTYYRNVGLVESGYIGFQYDNSGSMQVATYDFNVRFLIDTLSDNGVVYPGVALDENFQITSTNYEFMPTIRYSSTSQSGVNARNYINQKLILKNQPVLFNEPIKKNHKLMYSPVMPKNK